MPSLDSIESLRAWLWACPILSHQNPLRVDYLAADATEYAIYAVPSTLRSHENILGQEVLDDVQTQNFIFASKQPYGKDIAQNLENLAFYNSIVAWIVEQNNARNFPDWSEGTVKSVLPTLTPYMVSAGADSARYQIQIKVTYRRN